MNESLISTPPPDKAETVLLLHGATSVHDIWAPLLPLFPANYRIIPLALPGHLDGEPVDLTQPISLDLLSKKIVLEMHRQGIESAHVAGNSLGGWLALELARCGFAKSVTAFSPAGSWPNHKAFLRIARAMVFACRVFPLLRPLFAPLMVFTTVRQWLFASQMRHGERIPPSAAKRLLLAICRCPVIPPLIKAFGDHGAIRPLPDPGIPVNIVWSANDAVLPPAEFLEPMRDAVPSARFILLGEAGHVPMYDQPAAMVAHIQESIEQTTANMTMNA